MKKALIIGAGNGGAVTANNLAKLGLEVTVVEPKDYHLYQPGIVDYVFGEADEGDIVKPLSEVLDRRVNWLKDRAVKVEPGDRKVVTSSGRELSYDYLVLAPGVKNSPSPVPSWHSLEEARQIKELVSMASPKRIIVAYKAPIKCPAAPFEFSFMLRKAFPQADIKLLNPVANPPEIQRPMAEILGRMAKQNGIEVIRGAKVQEVDAQRKIVKTEDKSYEFDLVLFDSPIKVSEEFGNLVDESGFIPVDKTSMRLKGYDDVYVIGDATNIMTPPKTGAFAHFSSDHVVKRIKYDLLGNVRVEPFDGRAMCAVYSSHNDGAFIFMNYERSLAMGPSRIYFHVKRLFTSLYWPSLWGHFDKYIDLAGEHFTGKLRAQAKA